MQRIKQWTTSSVLAVLALSCASTTHDNDARAGNDVDADARIEAPPPPAPSWANGLSRDQIKDVQRQLAARGLYQGEIDGSPGQMTTAALHNFQVQQKIDDDQGLDANTRDALGLSWDRQPVSGAQNDPIVVQRTVGNDTSDNSVPAMPPPSTNGGQLGLTQLTKDQAKTLQSRLRSMGFYNGEVDGVVGDGTRVALAQYFRREADLAAQGIVSDSTIGLFANNPR
ncbi:MAG: hypothetical protein RL685_1768 [Pseudomonadota bacterium]|jgi:peptidoglycan hydrolase-like protein with peptidoglycan-binding domain